MMNDPFGPMPSKADISELTSDVADLLHNKGASLQGVVLADLVAMYFAGHHPGIRERMMEHWLKTVRGLIEVNEKMIFERHGVSSWAELGKPERTN